VRVKDHRSWQGWVG